MDYLNQTALYFQVKENIRMYIQQQNLKSGDKLPSENEFMDTYKVSRITVRRALDELEKEKLIYKVHGKGTFVANIHIQTELYYMKSFSEDMKDRGYTTWARVLENRVVEPPEEIRKALGLGSNARTIFIKRVRYADDNPIALEECYIPASDFVEVLQEDLAAQSLNKLMKEKYGVKFVYAEQYIKTSISNNRIREILQLKKQTAILSMKRIAYDETRGPVQFTLSYYRGDIYEYKVILPMRSTTEGV